MPLNVPIFLSHQALEYYGGHLRCPFNTHFQEYFIVYYQQPVGTYMWLIHHKVLLTENNIMCIYLQKIMYFKRHCLGRYMSKNEFQRLKFKY